MPHPNETRARWDRVQPSIVGQVAEFLVWTALEWQSAGGLHVFLPLRDRGLDGLVHRMADGAFLAVQVKSRSELVRGALDLVILEDTLGEDDALLIGVHVDGGHLGPWALVVDEPSFRRLSHRTVSGGRTFCVAQVPLPAPPGSPWAAHIVPSERLAEMVGGVAPPRVEPGLQPGRPAQPLQSPPAEALIAEKGTVGLLGETEVARRLALSEPLLLFRPFPDDETVELAVRHAATRRSLGLQVKTVGLDADHPYTSVGVYRPSFRPGPSTWLVALAWRREEERFEPRCLLVPSVDVARLAHVRADHLQFEFPVGRPDQSRFGQYLIPLEELAGRVTALLAEGR
ncbi:MAG: hypothetical protein M3024_03270 [Candidatus Dormibacteraeota bacterium]|nr:hypothetical protein [Candidatus Dormibacteraeota bacterium]